MSTDKELANALRILRAHDRDVEAVEQDVDDGAVIPVDGIPRTRDEICAMARSLSKHD